MKWSSLVRNPPLHIYQIGHVLPSIQDVFFLDRHIWRVTDIVYLSYVILMLRVKNCKSDGPLLVTSSSFYHPMFVASSEDFDSKLMISFGSMSRCCWMSVTPLQEHASFKGIKQHWFTILPISDWMIARKIQPNSHIDMIAGYPTYALAYIYTYVHTQYNYGFHIGYVTSYNPIYLTTN